MNPTDEQDCSFSQNAEEMGRELWHRQVGESSRAYFAFTKFRDAAGNRRLTDVASALNCSVANVSRWSLKWRWNERCMAFDIAEDDRQRAEAARGRTEMRRRHLKLGIMMQSIGAHALAELQQKVTQKLPLNLSADEARALLAAGAKLEADAVGPEGRASRYTQIVVNLADHEYPDEAENLAPIEGEKKKLLN